MAYTEPVTRNGHELYQHLQFRIAKGMTQTDLERILVSHFENVTNEPLFFTKLFQSAATTETGLDITNNVQHSIFRREYVADTISRNRRIKEMIVALEASANDRVIEDMLIDPRINSGTEINEVASRSSLVPSTALPSRPTQNMSSSATSQIRVSAHAFSHIPEAAFENADISAPQEAIDTEPRQSDPPPKEVNNNEPARSQEPSPPAGDPTAQRTELLWALQNPVVHHIKWKPKDLKKRGRTRGAKLLGDDVLLYSYSSSSAGIFYRHSKKTVDFHPRWRICLDNCDFFCLQKKPNDLYLIICAYHEWTGDELRYGLKMFNADGTELREGNVEVKGKVKAMKWKGTRLMVTFPYGVVTLWDVTEIGGFQNRRKFTTECEWISSIEIEGDTLVTLSNAEPFHENCTSVIEVWNAATDTVQRCCRTPEDYKGLICMSHHSEVIVAGSKDRKIRAFSVHDGACVKTLSGHDGSINACACNETYIISGDSKGVIKVWSVQSVLNPQEVNSNALLRTLDRRHNSAVLLMELGQNFMVTQDLDAKIFYWDFRQFRTQPSCYML